LKIDALHQELMRPQSGMHKLLKKECSPELKQWIELLHPSEVICHTQGCSSHSEEIFTFNRWL